jgi:hypothetical protein
VDQDKLGVVVEYVRKVRKRGRTKPKTASPDFNLSCEQVGEYYNLVERGLVCTIEGNGVWFELNNPEVLDGAYLYVTEGWRGQ